MNRAYQGGADAANVPPPTTAADAARAAQDRDAETPDVDPAEVTVWVAAVRRGIEYHKLGMPGFTHCGRSIRTGATFPGNRALRDMARPCPRCWTSATAMQTAAGHEESPADGADADAPRVVSHSHAAPAPSPARLSPGEGVTPPADNPADEIERCMDVVEAAAGRLAVDLRLVGPYAAGWLPVLRRWRDDLDGLIRAVEAAST
jgi:hypothetical protein